VKTQIVHQKLNVAHAQMEEPLLLNHSHSLKKLNKIKDAAHAKNKNFSLIIEKYLLVMLKLLKIAFL
jgi:hypothetical protein